MGSDGGIIVKVLVALWIGVLVFGWIAQSTELLGSFNGRLAWLLLGGGGVLLLVGLGVVRIVQRFVEARGRSQMHETTGDGP